MEDEWNIISDRESHVEKRETVGKAFLSLYSLLLSSFMITMP